MKSPPELWAEVSDADALARHLGEFGEIRIIRTEPERAVAWEGERGSGTVELEPSGWGTKVVVTARAAPRAESPEPAGAPTPRASRPQEVELELLVSRETREIVLPPPPPPAPPPRPAAPPRPAPPPVEHRLPDPTPEPRPRFFSRLFSRLVTPRPVEPPPPEAKPPAEPPSREPVSESEPPPPQPRPKPEVIELPISHAVYASRVPERAAPEPEPSVGQPEPAPSPDVLNAVLDSLGAAHHRPFSRG